MVMDVVKHVKLKLVGNVIKQYVHQYVVIQKKYKILKNVMMVI